MEQLPFKLRRARLQLMLNHPYLASAVARFPIIMTCVDDDITTMATDGYRIYSNSEFIEKISFDELIGVLAHELMHNLLGHIEREEKREPQKWNLAIDHATNLLLEEMNFDLPDPKCCDPQFLGMTAEEIYEAISGKNHEENWDIHLGRNADETNSKNKHLDRPTKLELKRIREGLCQEMLRELKELSTKGILPGNMSGLFKQQIEKSKAAQVPWQDLLSRFISGLKRNDFRNYPFNRKHLWRNIFLPSLGTPGPEYIITAIDTSASMSEEILSQVLSELDRIKSVSQCRMTLIECDTSIGKISEIESWETSFVNFDQWNFIGRGGTSLRPPFEWIDKTINDEGILPDAMIYLTDGYGDFPPFSHVPTMWVVPNSGLEDHSFPFGEVLRIESV